MNEPYSCFFITPIGTPGSEVNLRANEVYDMLVIPVLSRHSLRYLRGDENASSNHIGMDVIQCIREADLCIVDVSYPNCNVYYELGLADALKKPVILIKEEGVEANTLPADISSRKYVSYSCQAAKIRQSRSDLDAFVRNYLEMMDADRRSAAAAGSKDPAGLAKLEELLNKLQSQPEEATPAAPRLPMDLRPRSRLTPVEEAMLNELKQKLDTLTLRLCRNGAHDHAQIGQVLDKLRSSLGDAVYLEQLTRRCRDCGYIWQRYLECAMLWMETDLTYCALDVTWLQRLSQGIEEGYASDEQYLQAQSICERVIALSRGRIEERFIDPVTGDIRHYDEETARYYAGLCAYAMHRKTAQREHLRQAADQWLCLRGRRLHMQDTLRDYEEKDLRVLETESLLIEADWKRGFRRLKGRIDEVLQRLETLLTEEQRNPAHTRLRELFLRLLTVSLDQQTDQAAEILKLFCSNTKDEHEAAHRRKLAEDLQREAVDAVSAQHTKLFDASMQLIKELLALSAEHTRTTATAESPEALLERYANGTLTTAADPEKEKSMARMRELCEQLKDYEERFPFNPAHAEFIGKARSMVLATLPEK